MKDADSAREVRILVLSKQLQTCPPKRRPVIWQLLRREILARSQTQIARMEHEKGLR